VTVKQFERYSCIDTAQGHFKRHREAVLLKRYRKSNRYDSGA